jgi:hypothetical protein
MIIFLSPPDVSVVRRPEAIEGPFRSQALVSSYLATPDGQMTGSWPRLWITGTAVYGYTLLKAGNCCWAVTLCGRNC